MVYEGQWFGKPLFSQDRLNPQHATFKRGFQSTGTCDAFGAAAAVGRLLFRGQDAERRIQDAIGLAGGYPSGVAQFHYSGSSEKRIQAAHAAQSGVAAALLTQQGFSGPPTCSRAPAALRAAMPTPGTLP